MVTVSDIDNQSSISAKPLAPAASHEAPAAAPALLSDSNLVAVSHDVSTVAASSGPIVVSPQLYVQVPTASATAHLVNL